VISGVPAGGMLSAGHQAVDGSWQLSAGDLANLSITASSLADFTLHVTATATEATGDTASVSRDLSIKFDHSAAPSIIEGGSGSDVITGGAGNDTIYGGSMPKGTVSVPSIASEKDNDILHGGDGNDTIYGQKGNDQLFGEAGDDFLSGGKGNDLLYGGTGSNVINGNSGDDTIFAGGGNDTVSGGTGFDTLDFSASVRGLTIDASQGTAIGFNTASFSSIERIVGSSFDDNYKGGSADDMFIGGDGNDTIRGLGGADKLTGGAGNDTFVYLKKDVGAIDHITDFAVGDKLDLHDFLKSAKYASIGDVVHVTDGASGSMISVKSGSGFVDLAVLDGVHHTSAQDLLSHGMILT
jgi:Ca2+-binding RTX toxin-like protein